MSDHELNLNSSTTYTSSIDVPISPDQYTWAAPQEGNELFTPTLLLVKEAELGRIITEAQSQIHLGGRSCAHSSGHWAQALYSKLNARLWSWHDSLPGEMRWNKWSPNTEDVDPALANLQYVASFSITLAYVPN